MLNIAICDDEEVFLKENSKCIDIIMKSHGIEYTLDLYQNYEKLLDKLKTNPNQYDILLLDIIYSNGNGIEFASKLRKQQNNVSIIFISSSNDFLLEGYESEPCGYILKPVNIKKLKEAVMRAYKNIKHNTLTINNKSHMQSFSLDDILYIEIMNKTASFHLTGKRLSKANVSIQEIMQKLPSESFVQCHRSYLVNIAKIFSIKRYEITLCDGKTIPVSKRNYCNVQNAILRWSEEL